MRTKPSGTESVTTALRDGRPLWETEEMLDWWEAQPQLGREERLARAMIATLFVATALAVYLLCAA